jgi:hypothetical protein
MVRNYLAEAEKRSKELVAAATQIKSAPRKVGWLISVSSTSVLTFFQHRTSTTPSMPQMLCTSAGRQPVSLVFDATN